MEPLFGDFVTLPPFASTARANEARVIGSSGGLEAFEAFAAARLSRPSDATAFSSSKTPMCSLKVVAVSALTACEGPMLLKGTTAAATMQATRMPEAAACGDERVDEVQEGGPRDEREGRGGR